jgi:Fe-S-cluster containining protein
MAEMDFRTKYLQDKIDEGEQAYSTKNKPCDFLQEDGSCLLGDNKPENCKMYPFTDRPDRMGSLLSVLDTISICPVAYEIWERLKKEYGFRG